MRTVHQAASVVAALALAFGATACGGTAPKPDALPTTTTSQTPTSPTTTSPTATVSPVPASRVMPTKAPPRLRPNETTVDRSLSDDVYDMAWQQNSYIESHANSDGVAVAATKPGGTASINVADDFEAAKGNVIAVKVGPAGKGICISAYNEKATKATSPTRSMVFKTNGGGAQAALGAC